MRNEKRSIKIERGRGEQCSPVEPDAAARPRGRPMAAPTVNICYIIYLIYIVTIINNVSHFSFLTVSGNEKSEKRNGMRGRYICSFKV